MKTIKLKPGKKPLEYTRQQIEYITKNVTRQSDRQLALNTGLTKTLVERYRTRVLCFSKMRVRKFSFIDENGKKMIAMNELLALQEINYKGVMQDSVNHRIVFLQGLINGC